MKYSSLCLNGSVYILYRLAHTMVLLYLVHHTHILSTVLTAHDSQSPAGRQHAEAIGRAHAPVVLCVISQDQQ